MSPQFLSEPTHGLFLFRRKLCRKVVWAGCFKISLGSGSFTTEVLPCRLFCLCRRVALAVDAFASSTFVAARVAMEASKGIVNDTCIPRLSTLAALTDTLGLVRFSVKGPAVGPSEARRGSNGVKAC